MKFFFLIFLFFGFFPYSLHAYQVTDNFETTETGLLYNDTPRISTLGTVEGASILQQRWVEILSSVSKCYESNTCISGYRSDALYKFNTDTIALMYASNIDYLSFYVYIPQNENALNTNVSSNNNLLTANSTGNLLTEYFHFCKTSEFSYSMVFSTSPSAINNCTNETYGQKVGQGNFGQWQKVEFRLNSITGTIEYRLNSSEWSNTVNIGVYDLYFGRISWEGNELYGTSVYYEDNDVDTYRIDAVVLADFDSENLFDLNYTLGIVNEDWTEENVGCDINTKEYCGIATTSYAIAIQGQATSSVPLWKYEYQLFDIDGVVLEPQGAFSKSTTYPLAQSVLRTDAVIFPEKVKRIYLLKVCTGYQTDYPLVFGNIATMSVCKNQFIGNGYTDETLGQVLLALGKIFSTSTPGLPSGVENAWISNACDDIGITDVFKGVKCAMIWAFSPSQESLQKFTNTKNSMLLVYPIGYATIMLRDVTETLSSTSTDVFNNDIPVKELFGQEGGTTTIDMDNMLSKTEFLNPVFDFIETFLWLVFGGWLLMFGLTRKL